MSRKNDDDDDIDDLDSMANINNKQQRAHWYPLVTLNCQRKFLTVTTTTSSNSCFICF